MEAAQVTNQQGFARLSECKQLFGVLEGTCLAWVTAKDASGPGLPTS